MTFLVVCLLLGPSKEFPCRTYEGRDATGSFGSITLTSLEGLVLSIVSTGTLWATEVFIVGMARASPPFGI